MDKICRTCLRVPENLTSLYNDTTLVNKIEAIASVQIVSGENYPSKICHDCIANINLLYNFRKVIINNDKELRERNETLTRMQVTQTGCLNGSDVKSEESVNDNFIEMSDDDDSGSESQLDESVLGAITRMKAFKCDVCCSTFETRFKLYKHKRSAHITSGVCNVCGVLVRSDNLKRHVALHFATSAECTECGKVFKNAESLRGHKLIHKGNVFTCEVCGKSFKVKAEYTRHYRTHMDPEVGKVMCTICGKRVRDLRKHTNSHTGARPYSCGYCMKGFASPYALKVHTRQHTNEKPYNCQYCPIAFPQKVSLVNHLKSKHDLV